MTTTDHTTHRTTDQRRASRLRARLALMVTALVAIVALPALAAAPAQASVSHCGNGQCTIYFSQSETKQLGQGRIPAPPAGVPGQIRVAYYASAQAHRWFATQYGKQNKCSAFTLNIRPWATQGYYGYTCNWK